MHVKAFVSISLYLLRCLSQGMQVITDDLLYNVILNNEETKCTKRFLLASVPCFWYVISSIKNIKWGWHNKVRNLPNSVEFFNFCAQFRDAECDYTEWHHSECHYIRAITLNIIVTSFIILNIIILNIIILNIIILNIIILNIIILNIVYWVI